MGAARGIVGVRAGKVERRKARVGVAVDSLSVVGEINGDGVAGAEVTVAVADAIASRISTARAQAASEITSVNKITGLKNKRS